MTSYRRTLLAAALLALSCLDTGNAADFQSAWPTSVSRPWVGPEYWSNPLQDWRIANGRLECIVSGGNRNVALLTRRLEKRAGDVNLTVRLGRLDTDKPTGGWAGFRVGTRGRLAQYPELSDYRDDALRGTGLNAGLTTRGEVFLGRPGPSKQPVLGMPRNKWKVASVSSEHSADERAANVFDGDPQSYWHGAYATQGGKYPHELVLDLGQTAEIRGLGYLARQDEATGRIKEYEVYLGEQPRDWQTPVVTGQFEDRTDLQWVTFPPRRARYVRLVAKSGVLSGRPACAIAELYVLDAKSPAPDKATAQPAAPSVDLTDLRLEFHAAPAGEEYRVTVTATDAAGKSLGQVSRNVAADQLVGGVALVCDNNPGLVGGRASGRRGGADRRGGNTRFWFRDWQVSGSKVTAHDDRVFGPILWSQYTLSRGTLTVTAQMPPLGATESQEVRLEVREGDGWKQVGAATIDPDARTATIRLDNWDDSRDTPFRLVYAMTQAEGAPKDCYWEGVFRRDPTDKPQLVVAAFTGNADPAFPNVDLVKHVEAHDPDLLFFSGDQIYENVGGYGTQRTPVKSAMLDYLRKWYLYGWAYRTLLRERPTISIPDDHDVYQGNLWGAGGRPTKSINAGGYAMPPEWVRMVERTQTSNLPPAYDPTPIEQNLGVYYCEVHYGRVSFAVLEDRKFKSGPEGFAPHPGTGRSDHVTDPSFDPKTADLPGATLLGPRQLAFLSDWAADWRQTDFKVTLSQTVFANAATHHGGSGQYLVADYDSNGWPQTGRAKALHEIRRAFGFMIGGDQHLATLIHHGIDDWDDAGWSFAVPSIANFYLRAWRPKQEAHKRFAGLPPYTGQYLDGFGNKLSVWAATNPETTVGHEPEWLHSKKPGYGIVRLDHATRNLVVECWPRYADPTLEGSTEQYEGWPRTISQLDNYARRPAGYLPTLKVRGLTDPVLQVIAEQTKERVYTLRIRGNTFNPPVFEPGAYTVRVGEQPGPMKTLTGLRPKPAREAGEVTVNF